MSIIHTSRRRQAIVNTITESTNILLVLEIVIYCVLILNCLVKGKIVSFVLDTNKISKLIHSEASYQFDIIEILVTILSIVLLVLEIVTSCVNIN